MSHYLRLHWKMLLVLAAGIVLISPFPHAIYVRATSGGTAVPGGEADHGAAAGTVWVWSEKLGEALIIAAVLAVFVDESVKRTLVKETLADVLPAAVGYQLPQEVQEHIKYILRLPFVRRNFTVTYSFRRIGPAGGQPGCWEVTSVTEYNLHNLTDTQQPYSFRTSVEVAPPGMPANHLVKMEAPSLERRVVQPELDTIARPDALYTKASIDIHVPPSKEAAPLLRTERVAHYPREHTMVLDILEPPCLGITVCVHAPPGLDIQVAFGVPGPTTRGLSCWSHSGVHLPGTHFKLSWRTAQPAAPAPAPAVSA